MRQDIKCISDLLYKNSKELNQRQKLVQFKEELKRDTLNILEVNITSVYNEFGKIYSYKDKIINDTFNELSSIKITEKQEKIINGISKNIICNVSKYNINDFITSDFIMTLIDTSFDKIANKILNSIKKQELEEWQKNNEQIEDILYRNLSGLIREGYDKQVVIQCLKDGRMYEAMLTEEQFDDTKELQEAYIKAIPKLTKRLSLVNETQTRFVKSTKEYRETQRKKQNSKVEVPFIWKVYGITKIMAKTAKKLNKL